MAGITAAAIGALSGAVVVLATPRQRGYSHRLAGRANGRGLVEQDIVRASADFSRRIGRIGPRADIGFRELRNGASYTVIQATGFLLGGVHAVGANVHGQRMHFGRPRHVGQLHKMGRVLLLNNSDETAVASHVNTLQTRVILHHVAFQGQEEVLYRPMRCGVEHDKLVIVLAHQKRQVMERVQGHAEVVPAALSPGR